ncbi:MAG: hypothetical protein WCJ98_02785 [Mycobacteriaceae bacterium]
MQSPQPAHTVTGQQRSRPAHAARDAGPASRVLVVVIGVTVLAAVGIGAAALLTDDRPAGSTPGSARLITVTPSFPSHDKRP